MMITKLNAQATGLAAHLTAPKRLAHSVTVLGDQGSTLS